MTSTRSPEPDPADDWRWGVDVAARQIDICASLPDGSPRFTTAEVSFPLEPAAQLGELYRSTALAAHELLAAGIVPTFVAIEQPSGAYRNLPLTYATGVAIAALTNQIAHDTGHVPIVDVVPSSSWKRATLGQGNASPEHYTKHAGGATRLALTPDAAAAYWISRYAHTKEVLTCS